jgi:hypothetical protein
MRLTREQLENIKKSAPIQKGHDDWVDSKPLPQKNWTIEDLAKGRMFSDSMIKKIVSGAKVRRQQHRFANRGWTANKRMRSEVRIPTALYLQPAFQQKYFPDGMDEHERIKALEQLKRDFPMFVTHD